MQNVLITGGAGYVGHVLTPRWGAGVRPIDCADMFCLRYHPNCRRAASLMRSEVQGGSQTSSTLIALVSGEGTFQSRYFAAALAGPRLLVMVIASRRAQHPGLTRFGA
jgi:hypothetical protein